jgi:hypothetical protein
MSISYIPRNDFVLYRIVDRGQVRGVHIPQISAQGKDIVIVAVGPEVKDLQPGDKVFAVGTKGQDVIELPNEQHLYLSRQANIVLVVKDDAFEPESSKVALE